MNEMCNIWTHQCKPCLIKDEKWCPICNGLGASFINISFKLKSVHIRQCYLCKGEGKVDWITAVTKKITETIVRTIDTQKHVNLNCAGHLKCKKKLKRLWQNKKRFSQNPWHPDCY